MIFFTSSREKRLWLMAFTVFATIYTTLFIGRPLASQLRDQNVQAVFFLLGLLCVGAAIIVHGLRTKPSKIEFSILLGILGIYIIFIFRLGAPERSHVIEYSVLAISLHKAFQERALHKKLFFTPAFLALIVALPIGVLDESIQLFLPNRVYDPLDIFFNGLAVIMALGTSSLLTWIRSRMKKK